MKPREHNGVVDSRLNVYGTKDLKVAGMTFPSKVSSPTTVESHRLVTDMSICPSNVGSVSRLLIHFLLSMHADSACFTRRIGWCRIRTPPRWS